MVDYTLSLVAAPVDEPISLDEVLNQCHADAGIEDGWFMSKISAGRQLVEDYIKRSLVSQIWVLRIQGGLPAVLDLPRSPVQELISVKFKADISKVWDDVNIDDLSLFTEGCPARLILNKDYDGILRVEYRTGYKDKSLIPAQLRDAILLYVSYSYENRSGETEIPKAFYSLIEPYRLHNWLDA